NGAEQFFLGSQHCFSLRCDLADNNIAWLNFSAYSDYAAFVEVFERLLSHIRDVPGDVFRPEFSITGFSLKFFYMYRGIDIIFDQSFIEQYGILKIVTSPGHEGNSHIFPQCKLSEIGRRAVSQGAALLNYIPDVNNRLLVHASALVGAIEFDEVVYVDCSLFRSPYHYPGGIDAFNNSCPFCEYQPARIFCGSVFHSRADNR